VIVVERAAEHDFAIVVARLDQHAGVVERIPRLEELVTDAGRAGELGDVGVDELAAETGGGDRLVLEAAELVVLVADRAEPERARAEVVIGLLERFPALRRGAVRIGGSVQRGAAELVLFLGCNYTRIHT
jgi:hypothetical protein